MKKPPKIPGCASCPWGPEKDQHFVEPSVPEHPNCILVVGSPKAVTGHAGTLLTAWCAEHEVHPVVVGAVNCKRAEDIELPMLKECREAYVHPILAAHPGLPLVTMGEAALSSIFGGRRKLDHDSLYEATMKDGRLVLSTYGVGDWLHTKQDKIKAHIQTTLATAIRPVSGELHYDPEHPGVWALKQVKGQAPARQRVIEGMPMDDYLRQLFKAPAIMLDIEIDVPDDAVERGVIFPYPWQGGELVWLGLTDGTWYYLIPAEEALASPLLRNLAGSYTGIVAGHNIKGDLTFLAADGIEFPKATFHDTMLWHRVMPEVPNTSISLKWLAKSLHEASAYEAPVHTAWNQKIKTSQIPELMVPYLTLDLYYHWRLFEDQRNETHPSPSFALAMDYLPVIQRMEVNGFAVDMDGLDAKIQELQTAKGLAAQRVQDLARSVRDQYLLKAREGITAKDPKRRVAREKELETQFDADGLNLDSPAQVKAFFRATGLEIDSTNEKVLAEHADHPAASSLLDYRGLEKQECTYGLDWRRRVFDPRGDGLIHAHYSVSGAETTRLRCSDPNDQNVPGEKGDDTGMRYLRLSRYPGGKLLTSDLAGIEYRLIAHMSGDTKLRQLFIDGIDIHKDAAARVFGIRPEQVTKDQRKIGKTLNFAGVYGAGPEKVFAVIGREDMKLYYKTKNLYPGVARWKERLLTELFRTGEIRNCFDQWWTFNTVGAMSQAIEREAINRIVQAAGHVILVLYRLEVERQYQAALEAGHLKALPLLVQEGHDAFVDDLPGDQAEPAKEVVEYVAGGLNGLILDAFGEKMAVPITAEVKILDRWE